MSNSTIPTVIEDFLDEDNEVPGQRYVLLSFISPEKVLDKKEHYFFEKFVNKYEVDWKIKNLEKFLVETIQSINKNLDDRIELLEKDNQIEQADICRKNRLRIDDVMSSYGTFVQKQQGDINRTKIVEAYNDFMFANQEKLEDEFYAMNDFRTSIRGMKVRGICSNWKEAELKAKKLQNKDKYHNIFIGDVGKWLPWDPSPHQVAEQEYAQDQLNTLMKKYKENEDNRDKFFEENHKPKIGKSVFGNSTKPSKESDNVESTNVSDNFNTMFSEQGDLAFAKKMEKPITIERIEEAPKNDVVE